MRLILLIALFAFMALPAHAETTYDRVMASGKIRCGYVVWSPSFVIDPNTQGKSGVFFDLTNEMAKRLSLGVEWVEEAGWSTAIEGIKQKRYDAVCTNFWPTPARARLATFSVPVNYSPLYVWVKKDSPLLKTPPQSMDDLNKDTFTFSFVDGTTPAQIIARRFPNAKTVSYPEKTQLTDMLMGLAAGKGDVAIADSITMHEYLKANPDTLVKLFDKEPIVVNPNTMLLPAGETAFNDMVNTTLRDIVADGTFDEILKKNKANDLYIPLAEPYKKP